MDFSIRRMLRRRGAVTYIYVHLAGLGWVEPGLSHLLLIEVGSSRSSNSRSSRSSPAAAPTPAVTAAAVPAEPATATAAELAAEAVALLVVEVVVGVVVVAEPTEA